MRQRGEKGEEGRGGEGRGTEKEGGGHDGRGWVHVRTEVRVGQTVQSLLFHLQNPDVEPDRSAAINEQTMGTSVADTPLRA